MMELYLLWIFPDYYPQLIHGDQIATEPQAQGSHTPWPPWWCLTQHLSQTWSLVPGTVEGDQSLLDAPAQTELSSPVLESDYVHDICTPHHPESLGLNSVGLRNATDLKDDVVKLKYPRVSSDYILIMEPLNPLVRWQRIGISLTCQTYSASHLTRNWSTWIQWDNVWRVWEKRERV